MCSPKARNSVTPEKFATAWLAGHLARLLPGYPDVRVLVAFSGGVDSTALLGALAAAKPPALQLRALHVNHGLHPNSPRWAAHCVALARNIGVPLEVRAISVRRSRGASLEAAAREARYALFGDVLQAGEFLVTGHQEDDQLETVLLQLFRGAGVAGLAAMPEIAPFVSGWLARPLLTRTRQELVEWTRKRGLAWIEDDTNANEIFDRNYLRLRILPLIRERWQGVGAAVARTARHAAEAQRLLDSMARTDVERASNGPDLFVPTLRALAPDRRRNALRFWIARAGVRVPDTRRLEELAGPLIDARADANPRVAWGDAEVQRHADLLAIRPAERRSRDVAERLPRVGEPSLPVAEEATSAAEVSWSWRTQPVLELPDGGTLELKQDPHGPIDLDLLPDVVQARYRRGGERIRLRRGGPRRALKSLLQESRLSITERARLPLIFAGTSLLAAGALWVDERIQPGPGASRRARLIHRTRA